LDNFSLNTGDSGPVDMPTMIAEACKEMEEDLKPLLARLSGEFDPARNLLVIVGKAFDNAEVHLKFLTIFFDIFTYLPIDVRGKKYRFEFTTYSDITMKSKAHSYIIQTSLDKMPGTGHVTRIGWNEFVSQLVYTKDGKGANLPEPSPFFDDIEVEAEKPA